MSEIDTTILTDVRIYAQKLRDTLKNVVLQMQAEVKKRDGALSEEDREAAKRFEDKLHASAEEAEALVKELEPHVPTFLAQPYPEFAGGMAPTVGASQAEQSVDNAEDDAPRVSEEAPEEAPEKDEGSEACQPATSENKEEDARNTDNDDGLSPEARAIIEGFKRLTGGRPDPRLGYGVIPDRYK